MLLIDFARNKPHLNAADHQSDLYGCVWPVLTNLSDLDRAHRQLWEQSASADRQGIVGCEERRQGVESFKVQPMKARAVLHLGPKLKNLPVLEYQVQVNKLEERNAWVLPADFAGGISFCKGHLHAPPTGNHNAREGRNREELRRHWKTAGMRR